LPAAQSQRGVEVELEEPHQADAALRLPDEGGELLVGGAGREPAEQLPDVGLADGLKMPSRTAENGWLLVKMWRRTTISGTCSDAMCFLLSLEKCAGGMGARPRDDCPLCALQAS